MGWLTADCQWVSLLSLFLFAWDRLGTWALDSDSFRRGVFALLACSLAGICILSFVHMVHHRRNQGGWNR